VKQGTGPFGQGGSFVAGSCYLECISEEFRDELFLKLGLLPTVHQLFSVGRDKFHVLFGCLRCDVRDGVVHVYKEGTGVEFVSRFGPSIAMGDYPAGSMGAVVKEDYEPTGRVEELEWSVGAVNVGVVSEIGRVLSELRQVVGVVDTSVLCHSFLVAVGGGSCVGEVDCKEARRLAIGGVTFSQAGEGSGQRSDCCASEKSGCESGGEDLFDSEVLPEVEGFPGVAEKVVGSGASGVGFEFAGVVYSTKLERNRAWRQAAKLKKAGRKALGISRGSGGIPAWRVNARDNVSSVKHGYFSECPLDVQKELRDTRAQLLIARNKKDLGMVEKQIAQANSQEAVVKDCLRMLRITEQVKKKAAESRVGGWAETIADSAVVSFASSVPSSVPSLESVGIGRSALSSAESGEGVLDSAQRLRKLEYEARKAVIVSDFEEHGGFLHSHERVLELLADEYEDVLLTPLELEKKI